MPVGAVDDDCAAVRVDQMLDDGEAEAEPAVGARRRPVGLPERLEDRSDEVRRYARSGVGDGELDEIVRAAQRQVHGAAFRRELDGVRQQIPDDLLEPRAVRVERADRRLRVDDDLDPLGVGHRLDDVDRRADDVVHVDGRAREAELAGHDPRDVEQIVDQLGLPPRAVVDRVRRARALRVVECAAAQHVGPAEHGVERRPQLVRHDREELILQAIGPLRGRARRLLALEELLAQLLQVRHLGERRGEPLLLGGERALGIARLRQRAHRLGVQPRRLFHVALFVLEAPDEDPVRAIREVDRGEHHDRDPVLAAVQDDGRRRAGAARDHEAAAAPQKILAPDVGEPTAARERNRAGDETGVDEEVRRHGADQRTGQRHELARRRRAAEPRVRGAGRRHGDRLGRRAEHGSIERIRLPHAVGALRPDAGHRDDERVARSENQERHQIGRVRHGQRRAARQRDRQVHFPRRSDAREHEQPGEEQRPREADGEGRGECNRAYGDHGADVHTYGARLFGPCQAVSEWRH